MPEVKIDSGNAEVTPKVTTLKMNDDIRDSYHLYREGLKQLISKSSLTDLDSNYTRLPEFALRMSILFASLTGSECIEKNHWAKAIKITEDFRKSLHYLYQQITDQSKRSRRKTVDERILLTIEKKEPCTKREIEQQTGLKESEVNPVLANLKHDGIINEFEEGKTVKYRLSPR